MSSVGDSTVESSEDDYIPLTGTPTGNSVAEPQSGRDDDAEEGKEENSIEGTYIEASALLSHVQMLESKLPEDASQFGHPPPPKIHMCRIPTKEKGIVAMMAVTKRCISAQLVKEHPDGGSTAGSPVEVLAMQGEDQITCSTILALEVPKLSAEDKLILPDRNPAVKSSAVSLMSGGILPVAPPPRLAVVVGTSNSRVISVEFSIKAKSLILTRRNYYVENDVLTYFEPLPYATLTNYQRSHRRGVPGPNGEKPRRVVPFEPSDGVTSLVPYGMVKDGRAVTYVWLAFGDGTGVRLHHAAFFASVVQKHTEMQPHPKTLESILGIKVVRWEARLPSLEATTFTLIPIPKYHPSPLAPFPAWKKPEFDEVTGENLDADTGEEGRGLSEENFEALVYCTGAMAESFPTLAFYTSEDQFVGRREEPEDEDEDDRGKGNIIASVFGGIYGMLTGGGQAKEEAPVSVVTEETEEWDPNVPFPSLNLDPYKLYAACEIHDPPRQITQCTVEPEGDLAAIADTLGRVSLVDLSTKQIVRMWKGFRETTCYWMEVPRKTEVKEGQKSKTLYLVIHSRQRRVVEIWRTRHGPKVKTLQVNREAQVVSVREMSKIGYIAGCYLAHSNVPFSNLNQLQPITIEEDETVGVTNLERNRQPRPNLTMVPPDAAARLNRLKQLLSETNIECQSVDVFKALERIKSVEDLAVALDTLAASPTLERKMGVEGSTFQRLAVSYCKQKLDEAINEAGREAYTNPHVQLLAFKIAYYDQISRAYDVIHRHETSNDLGVHQVVNVTAPSTWGLEAIGWTSVYEKITKTMIDDTIPQTSAVPMCFYEFASALEPPKQYMKEDYVVEDGGYRIYFSDSTRTRREILSRIFKPLLGDIFSFSAVSQIFDALGTKADGEYVMQCFGEWFSSLSVKEVVKKAIFAEESPVKRFLQERITAQLEEDPDTLEPPMESIFQYCRHSEEHVRAFWLATLCHEAIGQVGEELEEKTYGKITKQGLVERWESLLRQLRVCLLVSLRLYGIQPGALPLSVHEVEKGEEFSPFQWLAHDELLMSHSHDEIVSLENACRISSHSFNASTPEADPPVRWKALQTACLASTLSADERSEYLVDFDDDDRLGALLLYLKGHNIGKVLVAHRALLLAAKWGKQPDDLVLLEDALVALRAIDAEELKRIAYAVRLEIWQSRIRPVYRALMFGFDDVQEISPEVVSPLFHQVEWVKTFSEITSTVLGMLNEFDWHEAEVLNLREEYLHVTGGGGLESWPAVIECPLLNKLVDKNKKMKVTAFEAHQMLMSALRVTQDFPKLARCIPSFYDLFTPGALFKKAIPLEDAEENQQALMQDAVVEFARNYNGPSMDSLDLRDIEVLSELFEFEMDNIRTLFLLAMYEFGKDRWVDEIVTRSAPYISVAHFCEGGVEIVCRRLNYILNENPTDEIQDLMGTLDANMCEWIKEKAENSDSLIDEGDMGVPIGNTHLFALRLLSLGASADIDKKERIKIHSLIVLSGSIVKGLEGLHPESRNTSHDMGIPPTPDRFRYGYDGDTSGSQGSSEGGRSDASGTANQSDSRLLGTNQDTSYDDDSIHMFADESGDQSTEVNQTTDYSGQMQDDDSDGDGSGDIPDDDGRRAKSPMEDSYGYGENDGDDDDSQMEDDSLKSDE